jgi:heme A synthase
MSEEAAAENRPPDPPQRGIRDRHVVLLATAIVALVLGLRLIGELVPGVDEVLGVAPLLIVALILVTVVVLVRALRPRRDGPGD